MIEYPSIINSSKAPRETCVAFDKLDGSNIRVKWTKKGGFNLFGSRTQLIDTTHPHLGSVIPIFLKNFAEPLEKIFVKEWSGQREIIVFGEYFGHSSFAGLHNLDESHKFVMFDVMIGHKDRSFIKPLEFVKLFSDKVEIPRVVYTGNLTDQFIADVRDDKYNTNEGVVCKGQSTSGAYRGKIWMCKIKTQKYLDRLKEKFGQNWVKYGE